MLVCGLDDGTVEFRHLATGKVVNKFKGHSQEIT